MKELIIDKLKQLEKDEQIKILLAVETGSRAWGFPSPDSDYDIRLIYKKEQDWYIQLSEGQDHVSYMSDDEELDLTGWELRKALRLITKSNASLAERLQSPIVYMAKEGFAKEMLNLAQDFFSPIAVLHHYRSMAIKRMESITENSSYRLKSLFYALRASCACRWVLENDTYPPIVYQELLKGISVSTDIKQRIAELVDLKSMKNEAYLHEGEAMLIQFVKDNLEEAEIVNEMLKMSDGDISKLDAFLRKEIND